MDKKDILTIGLGFGKTGNFRPNASSLWYAQACPDWKDTIIYGINYKQVDCNGDSTVNYSDTLAVKANYSKTHAKNTTANQGKPTDPHLSIVMSKDSAQAGDIVSADILYGSSASPVSNVYGLAFSVLYNSTLVDTLEADFSKCWLAAKPVTLSETPSSGQMDIAIARTNQKNTTGYGKLATLYFKFKSNITNTNQFKLNIVDNTQINAKRQYLPVYMLNDSLIVKKTFTGVNNDNISSSSFRIYPNPAKLTLTLKMEQGTEDKGRADAIISITDMAGRTVKTYEVLKSTQIWQTDISTLPSGMYFLRYQDSEKIWNGKFVKQE